MAEVLVYSWEDPKGYRRGKLRKIYLYQLPEQNPQGLTAWVNDWKCALWLGYRAASEFIESEKAAGREAFIETDIPSDPQDYA